MNGILIIDKEKGITSREVVNKVIKMFNTKKVGHTGTLDPLATGVLVVCVGSATKLVDELTSYDKEYIAEVCLGIQTDTLDITGELQKEEVSIKTKEEIIDVLNGFKGKYLQEVPIYSAIKVNGKKLYEYARNNEEIILPKKLIEIYDIELISDVKYENNKTIFSFKCSVSKGTYIRSLIRDIALKLNTIGVMTNLRRTRQGNFKIGDATLIGDISKDNLVSIKDALNITTIEITKEIEKKVLNGASIDNVYGSNEVLFVKNNEEIALYKLDNDKLKISKMFKGGVL